MAAIRPGFLWRSNCRSDGFVKDLETKVGKRLQLKINDNRAAMLSVKWERSQTRVSIHRMFLEAPNNVIDELAFYLRRKQKSLTPMLKAYIEEKWQKLDYSHLLDQKKMSVQGEAHDLGVIFAKVNQIYFDNKIDLLITWYGERDKRNRSRVTFGLYYDSMRLIKINRLLDNRDVPGYVVEFVVYHEILHHLYPASVGQSGRRNIHTKEFKTKEKQFGAYAEAKEWIKENYAGLFAEE